ncbi:unnamed protein product [Caenorhabditis angaria]|uniref:Uncharacterized protein n=1 Tax=Caenorhabditis angaria TaxID=860376 RepID=A0A9P1MVI5_9PELO|nr:unnamed protein product [Caenorhabditis angaria]
MHVFSLSQRSMLRNMRAHTHNVQYRLITPSINADLSDFQQNSFSNGSCGTSSPSSSSIPPTNCALLSAQTSSGNSANSNCSANCHDQRFFNEFHDEFSLLRQQRSLAQISFKTCEPREEDRSRRAANRRQKRWRC